MPVWYPGMMKRNLYHNFELFNIIEREPIDPDPRDGLRFCWAREPVDDSLSVV